MASWKYEVKGWSALINGESLPFEDQRDQLVALLRASDWFKSQDEDSELEWAVDDLACAESAEDADDDALYRIYNLADDQRAWLD